MKYIYGRYMGARKLVITEIQRKGQPQSYAQVTKATPFTSQMTKDLVPAGFGRIY